MFYHILRSFSYLVQLCFLPKGGFIEACYSKDEKYFPLLLQVSKSHKCQASDLIQLPVTTAASFFSHSHKSLQLSLLTHMSILIS